LYFKLCNNNNQYRLIFFNHSSSSVSHHWQFILELMLQQNSFGSDMWVPISKQRRDQISHILNIIICVPCNVSSAGSGGLVYQGRDCGP